MNLKDYILINTHNKKVYNTGKSQFICTRCQTITDLDSSFSDRGDNLVCSRCMYSLCTLYKMTVGNAMRRFIIKRR